MNVRIDHQGVRFRISAEELKMLQKGKVLKESLRIGQQLSLVIDPVGVTEDLGVLYDDHTIRLLISPENVNKLAALGRSREGLEQKNGEITVSLQVDFRTQKHQTA